MRFYIKTIASLSYRPIVLTDSIHSRPNPCYTGVICVADSPLSIKSSPAASADSIGSRSHRMSSTLVETVSINYEDFSDSFLTCGTCLCVYDGVERIPKLLACSHTVCQSCLERIIEAQVRGAAGAGGGGGGGAVVGSFRCPICRETITVPRGGVAAFPPSFIVNQVVTSFTCISLFTFRAQ